MLMFWLLRLSLLQPLQLLLLLLLGPETGNLLRGPGARRLCIGSL
jgi:hypothetical protein